MVDNVRLPTEVEQGAVGGPRFKVIKQTAMSGKQQRIQQWDQPLGQWNIGYVLRDRTDLIDPVLNLFLARGGPELPFRFKDWLDFEFTNELIGTGNGVTDAFQLIKTYTDTVRSYTYNVLLPVSGSITITVAGETATENTDYIIDYSTGIVTFESISIPSAAQAIRATGEFDRPVIFNDDALNVSMMFGDAGSIERITLSEVRDE